MSSSEIGLGNSRPLKSLAMYFIGNYFSPFFFLYSQLLFVFCKICLSPHSFISARPNAFRKICFRGNFLICPYIAVLHFASSAMTAGYYLTHYPTCYFRKRPLQLSGYLRNKFFSCLYDLTRKNINVVYLDDNLSGPTNSVIVRPPLSPLHRMSRVAKLS